MSRRATQKSQSGIYHVMLRGINQQQLFEEAEDYDRFLEVLGTYTSICEYELYAYCLMGNYIHLLIKPIKEDLELIFKRLGGSYVYWYNWKYRRKGQIYIPGNFIKSLLYAESPSKNPPLSQILFIMNFPIFLVSLMTYLVYNLNIPFMS